MEGRSSIVVGPVWSRITGSPEAVAAAGDALSTDDPGAKHTRAFRSGRWDGKEHFLKKPSNEFLSGFVSRVARSVTKAGLPAPVISWPPATSDPPLAPDFDFAWRPHQTEGIELLWRRRRGAVQAPMQSGKTEIGIEFVRRVGRKTLWMTHTRELLRQTSERFRDRLGLDVGTVGGSSRAGLDKQVVVGMVQTLCKMNKSYFSEFGCLVADEGHHAGARTWQDIARSCTRADYRLALSATMTTDDPVANMRIEGAFGPVLVIATTAGLADLGFVARPRVVMVRVPPTCYPSYEEIREVVCPSWREDPRRLSALGTALFREAYFRGVVSNPYRTAAIARVAAEHARKNERFLVLCNSVPHAESVAREVDRLLPAGCAVFLLNGSSPAADREAEVAKFKQRKGAVLIATPFFREGVSVPEVDAGFLAGGGESSVAVPQALGRMLTVRPDKREVLIYDCFDGRSQHAKDYLRRHTLERLSFYREQGFSVDMGAAG